MKAPNGPVILLLFCGVILTVNWIAVVALTTPARALACGVALCLFIGPFLWLATTDRHAIARGLIALGATAFASPLAAIQGVTNDMLFSMFSPEAQQGQLPLDVEAVLTVGWRNVAIGAGLALVLIIAGGVLHRTPRNSGDGAAR